MGDSFESKPPERAGAVGTMGCVDPEHGPGTGMRISNRSIYAVEALALMALGDPSKPLTVQSISDAVGISVSYTERIFAGLRDAGLVRAEKGPGGGYYLKEPAEKITVADIVAASEEPNGIVRPRRTAMSNGQTVPESSPTELLWERLDISIHRTLANIHLADIVPRRH